MRIRQVIGLFTAMTAMAPAAYAQTGATAILRDRIFASINVGGQTQARTLTRDFTLPVYGQTASVTTVVGVDGGSLFDVSAGYRVFSIYGITLGAGVGFTSFGDTGKANVAASVPHPAFFNRHASATVPEMDAKRSERSTYVALSALYPLTDSIEIAVFAGPSFLRVKQDVIGDVSVPFGTQTVEATLSRESASSVGALFGVDASYAVTDHFGGGIFLRYNGGSVDLPSAPGAKVGGFQFGLGLRVRY